MTAVPSRDTGLTMPRHRTIDEVRQPWMDLLPPGHPWARICGPPVVQQRRPGPGQRRPFWRLPLRYSRSCGGRGIRTHEELAPLAVFKTAAIGH